MHINIFKRNWDSGFFGIEYPKTTFAIISSITLSSLLLLSFASNNMQLAIAQGNTTNSTGVQSPVDGYDAPERHESSIFHTYEPTDLRVHHYCKPAETVILVCQLYDGNNTNAKLIGIEYFISNQSYNSLPDREKANWHIHDMSSFALDKPIFHELSPQQAQGQLQKLVGTYGKIIITWNPTDQIPSYPPQIINPGNPFMLNKTK